MIVDESFNPEQGRGCYRLIQVHHLDGRTLRVPDPRWTSAPPRVPPRDHLGVRARTRRTPPPLSVGDPVLGKPACSPDSAAPAFSTPAPHASRPCPAQADGRRIPHRGQVGDLPRHAAIWSASEAPPAICRGFADRYTTWRLQVIARLFGFVEVPPPGEPTTTEPTMTEPSGD
ncbi:hypothetical protein [Virgisporangium aurantiacum]|uniref:hypothetical protein n=1 Tax=Virgisporangium aurantiacum TaxID=175570 RepID=UPI001EF1D925|nr:hypothetical protein [Virgisporangium aurantiacum]